MSHRKTINRMTAGLIRGMTDAQIEAVAAIDPHDMRSFTDAELEQIISGSASPDLIRRVALTRKTQ